MLRLNLNKKIADKTENNGTRNVDIMVPSKYLSNFRRTLEISLINCKIDFILSSSTNCVLSNAADQATAFATTDRKRYVPVVTLLNQDNTKLLQQLKSGLKRKIGWNKYQSKITTQAVNRPLE